MYFLDLESVNFLIYLIKCLDKMKTKAKYNRNQAIRTNEINHFWCCKMQMFYLEKKFLSINNIDYIKNKSEVNIHI